jgi:hypothetical protein
MWAKPTKAFWDKLPKLYDTEKIPLEDKIVHGHFFMANCDWYIVEGDRETGEMFGWCCLGDPEMAEWGYVSFNELKDLKVRGFLEVDFDRHWTKRKVKDVKEITDRCRFLTP